MQKPTLVILAAGMGSRYGGLKQIDPIDNEGNIIIDYSIYDAIKAGFSKIIFVIKKEIEETFKSSIGKRISKIIETEYVYQELDMLPDGFTLPEGRVKPWGTAHAVLCCKDKLDGSFAVINSDDFYGAGAYRTLYEYLTDQNNDTDELGMAMVGYQLNNTLTENGFVSRGVCKVNEEGFLVSIDELTHIEKNGESDAKYTKDEGKSYTFLDGGSIVSMNMWGFKKGFLDELSARFPAVVQNIINTNPLKGEFFLPVVVGEIISETSAKVRVLRSTDKWYGVTYAEDKPGVISGIAALREQGVYKAKLWEGK